MKHNRNTYLRHKCRCELCVADAADYRRRRRIELGGDTDVRLPGAPLLAFVRKMTDQRIQHAIVKSWLENGVSPYTVDKWCTRFGSHPAEVYGDEFYRGCFEEEVA
jgi:hypothetical protein